MVVLVFTTELLIGVALSMFLMAVVPMAAAVGNVHAMDPARFVEVTVTGVALPVRAAVVYMVISMKEIR